MHANSGATVEATSMRDVQHAGAVLSASIEAIRTSMRLALRDAARVGAEKAKVHMAMQIDALTSGDAVDCARKFDCTKALKINSSLFSVAGADVEKALVDLENKVAVFVEAAHAGGRHQLVLVEDSTRAMHEEVQLTLTTDDWDMVVEAMRECDGP